MIKPTSTWENVSKENHDLFCIYPGETITRSKCGKYWALIPVEVEQPEVEVTVTIVCSESHADAMEKFQKPCLGVKSFTRSDKKEENS